LRSMKRKKRILGPARDDSTIRDFHALADLYTSGRAPPGGVVNVNLPSGRYLHNPAKRRVKDASRWTSQQIENAKSAAADWLSGVQNPARDPIAAAIDAKMKWQNRLQAAITDDRFVKGLRKSSLSEIQAVAAAVGPEGFSRGIEARAAKIARVNAELQPLSQAVSDAIQALPDATDSDRAKRLTEARRLMLELGKRRRG